MWVFGYGSLLWQAEVGIVERRVGTVVGIRRAFNKGSVARGCPVGEALVDGGEVVDGRVVGLALGTEVGGAMVGVAVRYPEGVWAEVEGRLWAREGYRPVGGVENGYVPRVVEVEGAGVEAVVFASNEGGRWHRGGLGARGQAEGLIRATPRGVDERGCGLRYLARTREGLRAIGVVDEGIEAVVEEVRKAGFGQWVEGGR